MNLFNLAAKLTLNTHDFDEGVKKSTGKGKKLAHAIGGGLKKAASVGAKALGVAAAGLTTLTTVATKNFADYEQLVGGSKLMFGDAYDFIADKAKNAYATVQMSQNDYLQQVNGLATGLKTALGGDAQAAAELADRVVTAEADVVAATGASQESIQNAFNGIMKSNYTMLDNLQLGITPTKEGFQSLIDEVNAYNAAQGNATNYQISNLADAQAALVDYIAMQGMAGYASMEASETITGSIAGMKAAWTNLTIGLADENADIEQLLDNFITSVGNVATNIKPVIERILTAIATKLVDGMPEIAKKGGELLAQLAVGIIKAIPVLIQAIPKVLDAMFDAFDNANIDWGQIGRDVISGIWHGILSLGGWLYDKISGFFSGLFSGGGNRNGSHAGGLREVPFDGYVAQLHRGERILTKDEAAAYDSNRGGTTFSGLTINISGANYRDENALAEAIAERLQGMADRKAAVYA